MLQKVVAFKLLALFFVIALYIDSWHLEKLLLSHLRARKNDNNRDSWKSNNYKRVIKERSKEIISKINQRRKTRAITLSLQATRENE